MKAILKNGVIHLLDPLPAEWTEGDELEIQHIESLDSAEAIDKWLAEMNALCADSTPEDEAIIQAAIDEQKRPAKELMRREMGLPA